MPANLRWLIRPLLVVWFFYLVTRFAFIGIYWKNFDRLQPIDWLEFSWLCLRFDSSALFTINLVFISVMLLPLRFPKAIQRAIRLIFVAGNWTFLVINAVDVPFFAFNTRRTSYDALKLLLPEFWAQLPQFSVNYWPVALASAFLFLILFKSFGPFPKPEKARIIPSGFAQLIWLALGIFIIRNSVQLKPLMPGAAFTLTQPEAGHGILNTPFLLFKTLEMQPLTYKKWLRPSEMNEALALTPEENNANTGLLAGQNVVILILESFATEYTGLEGTPISYTPFLDSLAGEGVYFPHHFANGRTSRDALPSLFASIPSWMEESFVTSQYVSIRLDGLGSRFNRSGYQTLFFHGGKNGTMAFDVFSKQAGFQQYYGLNEYPEKADFDGHWGVFDEPFLNNMAEKLSQTKTPFAAAVFTLSSHQPYTIPDRYKGRFKKGPLAVHEAISYADYALRQFFTTASAMPWFSNTLFVLTADHTQESADSRYQTLEGGFDVPLILYHPRQKLQADTSRWVQHLDLAPSLTDLFGLYPDLINPLGASVFGKKKSFPIQYQDQMYHQFSPMGFLSWKGESPESGWVAQRQPDQTARRNMVAAIQYYRRGLTRDSLFNPILSAHPIN